MVPWEEVQGALLTPIHSGDDAEIAYLNLSATCVEKVALGCLKTSTAEWTVHYIATIPRERTLGQENYRIALLFKTSLGKEIMWVVCLGKWDRGNIKGMIIFLKKMTFIQRPILTALNRLVQISHDFHVTCKVDEFNLDIFLACELLTLSIRRMENGWRRQWWCASRPPKTITPKKKLPHLK